MANSAISDDEKVSDTEREAAGDGAVASGEASGDAEEKSSADSDVTDGVVEDPDDDDDEARSNRPLKRRLRLHRPQRPQRPRRPKRWAAAVLAAAALAGGLFGFVKYHEVTGQLADLHRDRADREAVAQLAKDYALKSLTYSFEDPDAFFRSVEDGVSQQLKDKYVNATDVLKSIMLGAQVTSTGEVLAIDPVAQPGGAYQVVVSAHQTTRNLQNPTPKVSIILLQVTVNRVGNAWQVSDIGPKSGAHPPVEEQIPPTEPPPAPGTPAPKR